MRSSTSVWSRFLNRQFGHSATSSRRRRDSIRRRNRRPRSIPAEVLEVRCMLSATTGEETAELRIATTSAAVHRPDGDVYPVPLQDSDFFGQSMTGLGDLDGDGVNDMAVGANGDDSGGINRGAVYVLFMNADGTVKTEQKISSTEGNFTGVLDDGDGFGNSLASLGDFDGDGVTELLVGASGDDDGGTDRGAAYVLFLNANGTVRSYQKISSTAGNFAATLDDSDAFGRSATSLGDLDADGVSDVVIGASQDDDGGTDRGAVYILHLNADGTVKSNQKISSTSGNFTATLDDSDLFGASLTGLGDLDGDGVNDMAVGAISDNDGGSSRGALYTLFLNADGTIKSHQKISSTEGGFTGTLDDGDQFGKSVTSLGDLDGDGITDLVVGAHTDDDGGIGRGAVYVLFMNANGTVKGHQKISDTEGNFSATLLDLDFFGVSVTSLGDLDGDGINDLGVGAIFDDGFGSNRGAAYILFLNADGTVKSHKEIGDTEGSPFDFSQTFLLHSNPGALHTVYLDFDGHTTSGTNWNSAFTGGADIVTPAYDFDGDPSTFNDYELARIQRIWQRVAEDFLPFNVNVTTQDPGAGALIKTSQQGGGKNSPPPDTQWGVRIVIGGSSNDWFGSLAGGVAYIGSFNWASDTPAFVFPAQLSASAKNVAEAISHEAGHTLGLSHDGRTSPSEGYYAGHGSGATGWAPIMGVGYYEELTQWSKGEYAFANNTQDDLAIITTNNGFGYRADDYGNSAAAATELIVSSSTFGGSGIIERNTDSDWFSFTTVSGDVNINVDPAERGPNLDILARLYDASNVLIATSNPLDTLDAAFQLMLAAGTYYVSIDGVGKGDPLVDGYTDYGSLGQYFISGSITPVPGDFLSIAATDAAKAEGNAGSTAYTFTVTRAGDVSGETYIDYVVAGSGANPADASDFAGGVWPTGTIVFAIGQTEQVVTIYVNGDVDIEQTEGFTVTLVNPTGLTHIVTGSATGSIVNDDFLPTKFYVVDDAAQNITFEYDADGGLVESYALDSGNTAPRGAASSIADDKTWVVDANRKVYVYDASGALLGSWTAGTLATNATVEGIATNGTDIWIVDAKSDKVYKYAGAATRLSGSQNAASSFSLNSGNRSPKDIVTDGVSLWVVNDSTTDKVFKYSVAGALQGSWTIDSANSKPTGITIDPSNVSNIWIVDSGTDKIYQYNTVASRTAGSQTAAAVYSLAAGNTNPQGIADPPTSGNLLTEETVSYYISAAPSSASISSSIDSLSQSLLSQIALLSNQTSDVKSMTTPAANRLSEILHHIERTNSSDAPTATDLDDLFADWNAAPLQLELSDAV